MFRNLSDAQLRGALGARERQINNLSVVELVSPWSYTEAAATEMLRMRLTRETQEIRLEMERRRK